MVRCTDLGRFALIETESGMARINMLSQRFHQTVSAKKNEQFKMLIRSSLRI